MTIYMTLVEILIMYIGVLLIRVGRTTFDVITRRIVKVHRDRIFRGYDRVPSFRWLLRFPCSESTRTYIFGYRIPLSIIL